MAFERLGLLASNFSNVANLERLIAQRYRTLEKLLRIVVFWMQIHYLVASKTGLFSYEIALLIKMFRKENDR